MVKRKNIFILFNILYFGFNYFAVPYLPNPPVLGFMPFQLFINLISMPMAAVAWGLYFNKFFDKQHAYQNKK